MKLAEMHQLSGGNVSFDLCSSLCVEWLFLSQFCVVSCLVPTHSRY
jgi:hypothetical protein